MSPTVSRVVFGAFDGFVSAAGLIAGLAAGATPRPVMLVAALALAAASAVGMAAGDWLSDDTQPGPGGAAVMGAATFGGALAPALPVALLPPGPGWAVTAVVSIAVVAVLAELRARTGTRTRPAAYLGTLAVLIAAAVLAAAASLLAGVTA